MSSALTLDLPEDVRRQIEAAAQRLGQSTEDFILTAAAARLEDWEAAARFFQERASRAKPGDALRFFDHEAGGEPPRPGDEIA